MSLAYPTPAGSNAIGSAVSWIEGTLLGSLATTIAVIAVASVGFLMLTGRIDLRRAVQVIFGCFIIFGASTLATGIQAIMLGGDVHAQPAQPVEITQYPAPAPPVYPEAPPGTYDPYAGAALTPR